MFSSVKIFHRLNVSSKIRISSLFTDELLTAKVWSLFPPQQTAAPSDIFFEFDWIIFWQANKIPIKFPPLNTFFNLINQIVNMNQLKNSKNQR